MPIPLNQLQPGDHAEISQLQIGSSPLRRRLLALGLITRHGAASPAPRSVGRPAGSQSAPYQPGTAWRRSGNLAGAAPRSGMTARGDIALIGNTNCGKTSLFNQLTGSRQIVGNWPGVTVERKAGNLQLGSESLSLVDLPGLYRGSKHIAAKAAA